MDLDLDELDQAVNEMMDGRKRKKAGPRKADDAVSVVRTGQTPMRPPAPRAELRLVETEPANRSSAGSDTTLQASVPASRPMPRVPERKRTHRGAMDIIQPNGPKVAPPSARPARTAPALQPTKPVAPEPPRPVMASVSDVRPPARQQPEPAPAPEPAYPVRQPEPQSDDVSDELLASLALNDQPSHKSAASKPLGQPAEKSDTGRTRSGHDAWPDPLDFHDFNDGQKAEPPQPAPHKESEPEPKPENIEPSGESSGGTSQAPTLSSEPGPSPFLTTKVEKRPLGAYAAAATQIEQSQQPSQQVQKPKEPTLEPDEAMAAPFLPEEPPAQPTLELQAEPASAPDDWLMPGTAQAAHGSFQGRPSAQPQPDSGIGDLRQMSIPPQYQPARREPSEEVRNMFDVKEYHAAPQPIYHAKKSSPWLTATIVVLSVLVVLVVLTAYFMMSGIDLTKLW